MQTKIRSILLIMLTVAVLLSAGPALALEKGDLLVRGRLIHVSPNDDSGEVTTLDGSGVTVDSATTLELDFTKMLTDHWGLELILGTTKHDIDAAGSIEALGNIGDTGVLPPTLTLQYHFLPDGTVRPYLGAGLNYTLFYSESSSDSLDGALGATSVSLDSSLGLAAQTGMDIGLGETWFLNFDVKYISMTTEATLNSGGTIRTVDVDINPWVFGIGVGRSF